MAWLPSVALELIKPPAFCEEEAPPAEEGSVMYPVDLCLVLSRNLWTRFFGSFADLRRNHIVVGVAWNATHDFFESTKWHAALLRSDASLWGLPNLSQSD